MSTHPPTSNPLLPFSYASPLPSTHYDAAAPFIHNPPHLLRLLPPTLVVLQLAQPPRHLPSTIPTTHPSSPTTLHYRPASQHHLLCPASINSSLRPFYSDQQPTALLLPSPPRSPIYPPPFTHPLTPPALRITPINNPQLPFSSTTSHQFDPCHHPISSTTTLPPTPPALPFLSNPPPRRPSPSPILSIISFNPPFFSVASTTVHLPSSPSSFRQTHLYPSPPSSVHSLHQHPPRPNTHTTTAL